MIRTTRIDAFGLASTLALIQPTGSEGLAFPSWLELNKHVLCVARQSEIEYVRKIRKYDQRACLNQSQREISTAQSEGASA
ncbi:hypothetical protein M433DRAFT_159845 [Acidomyces richmondensis BFW]|nr:MAG: hypothetical protein FE78DRAFT_88547 [Acidomyces sp. 'richmondensis']KYG39980.1 hypothetical protein M433DRAFT_161069 [Acidomyces richmondensis BFW]KYG40830.1 hypothetical protein M433DRAFT_159845 [Acidomyces richmondensis BFW]